MSNTKTIYLASPYGFSKQSREKLLPEFVAELEGLGLNVLEPFSRNGQIDLSQPGAANRLALADLRDVRGSDAIFAIVNGTPPDEGVMVELGVSIALGKPTFLFRDDFRRCSDSDEYPLNLMLFSGIPYHSWKNYLYTSLSEIKDPKKALIRWLKDSEAVFIN